MLARIFGLVLVAVGIAVTFGVLWLTKILHLFSVKLVALGPMIASFGLGAAIFGKGIISDSEDDKPGVLGWLFLGIGGVAGFLLVQAVEKGDFSLFEKTREKVAEQTGFRERPMTREEVDAAVQEVNARGVELRARREKLNTANSEAMKQFEADAAAHNKRSAEVRQLLAKYHTQTNGENAVKTKLIGAWKYGFTASKGSRTNEVTGTMTYSADGTMHVDAVIRAGRKEVHPSWNGRWELTGDKLVETVESVNADCTEKAGEVKEYRILEVNDRECRMKSMRDGFELAGGRL